MTTKRIFTVLFSTLMILSACNSASQDTKATAKMQSDDVQIYYFHNTKRCATCNAIEAETKTALELFYAEQMKEGKVEFTSLNLEEKEGKEMASTLKVSGQTLLIVKGDEKVNLTNQAFMNARTKPDEFHELLKVELEKLL